MPEQVAEQPDQKTQLAAQIALIIEETFALRRQVVLLAYLGQALRKGGMDFRAILGDQKLADFIRERLSDRVKIVSSPTNPLTVAAVPIQVDLDKEVDPFGASSTSRSAGSQRSFNQKRELLIREVWFAFSHKLEAGKARVVRLEPNAAYEDFDAGVDMKPLGFEVPSELIVPSGSHSRHTRDELIYENVQAWAKQHGVSFQTLTESDSNAPNRRNALDILLNSLTESELSRITFPLDLVWKLRKKSL